MSETYTPQKNDNLGTIIHEDLNDPYLTQGMSAYDHPSAPEDPVGLKVAEINESGSKIEHRAPITPEDVAMNSLRNGHTEHTPVHIPVLEEDDDTEVIPVVVSGAAGTTDSMPDADAGRHPVLSPADRRRLKEEYR